MNPRPPCDDLSALSGALVGTVPISTRVAVALALVALPLLGAVWAWRALSKVEGRHWPRPTGRAGFRALTAAAPLLAAAVTALLAGSNVLSIAQDDRGTDDALLDWPATVALTAFFVSVGSVVMFGLVRLARAAWHARRNALMAMIALGPAVAAPNALGAIHSGEVDARAATAGAWLLSALAALVLVVRPPDVAPAPPTSEPAVSAREVAEVVTSALRPTLPPGHVPRPARRWLVRSLLVGPVIVGLLVVSAVSDGAVGYYREVHSRDEVTRCDAPASLPYDMGPGQRGHGYHVYVFSLDRAFPQRNRAEAWVGLDPGLGFVVGLDADLPLDRVTCRWTEQAVTITEADGTSHVMPASTFTAGR
jgi:hypothetical protein